MVGADTSSDGELELLGLLETLSSQITWVKSMFALNQRIFSYKEA